MRVVTTYWTPCLIYLLLLPHGIQGEEEEDATGLPCIPPPDERPAPEDGVNDPYACTSYVAGLVWPNQYEFELYRQQYTNEGGRFNDYATTETGRRGNQSNVVWRCYDPTFALKDKNKYITNNPCFVGAVGGLGLINTAMASEFIIGRYDIDNLLIVGIAGSTTGYEPPSKAEKEDGNESRTQDETKNCVCDVVIPDQWVVTDLQIDMPTGSTPEDSIPLDGIDFQKTPPAMPYHRGQNLTWLEPSHFIQGNGDVTKQLYWPADARLLTIAQQNGTLVSELIQCSSECRKSTQVWVGGTNGGSSNTFVANAQKAIWLRETYNISVVDMETAAAAQVAYTNAVPFLGIRGISDDGAGDLVLGTQDATEIDAAAVSMQNAASVANQMLFRLCSDAAEYDYFNDTATSTNADSTDKTNSGSSSSSAAAPSTLAVFGGSMARAIVAIIMLLNYS